jgi:beta-lactam-binding protein with PASTA domain
VRDDDLVIRGPGLGTVVMVSFLISLLVSAGVYVTLREVLPPKVIGPASAGPAPGVEGDVVDVPSVMGVDVAQARGLLDPKGLLLSLDGDREDPAAPGSIVSQAPLAGSRAQRGSTVHATVSRGQVRARIPELTGKTVEQATRELADAKHAAGPVEQEQNASAPAGTVLGSTPAAGTEVARGAEVRLRVSAGPGSVDLPKVTGMQLAKARELLERAKLVIATKAVYDEEHYEGVVLKQDPPAGAKVAPGSTVTLSVTAGE